MQNFNQTTIVERVRLLRTQCGGARGKSKFAQALGISASTYNYYEDGRVPPIELLLKMCEVTGADLEWLLTGRRNEKKSSFGPNDSLLRKLDALLTENPDLAEPILAFVELLCEKKGLEKQLCSSVTTSKSDRPGWIPVLGRTAAGMVHCWGEELLPEPKRAVTELEELVKKHTGKAIIGSGDRKVSIDLQVKALIDGVKRPQVNLVQVAGEGEGGVVEFIECDEVFKLFPDSFALQVDGDSMSPRINDGDIVIISPSVPAAQGQAAIVRIANQIGVTCKLIRTAEEKVHLIPINEKYETRIVAKDDLLWAAAVLCHINI